MKKIIVITGQTGTGKTSQALKLARDTGSDIISADSRQVYKYLDIITGKDMGDGVFHTVAEEQGLTIGFYDLYGIKVWGHDIVTPERVFTAHEYLTYVHFLLTHTIAITQTPIVVGGTYLYLHSLLNSIDEETGPDWKLRKTLETKSIEQLQNILQEHAPEIYTTLNNSERHNPHRLMRKIEIALADPTQHTRNQFSKLRAVSMDGFQFASPERARATIEKRVHARIAHGAFEEVDTLINMGYTPSDPGLNTIGYKEILRQRAGELTREEAIERWILSEVQYAKRQKTFMKRNHEIRWHAV